MRQQWRVPVLCITAGILLVLYQYEAQPEFFDARLARRFFFSPVNELYRHLYSFIATFVLLGLLPATIAGVLWNERPSAYGLGLGRKKLTGIMVSLALFGLMVPVLAHASTLPAVSAGHPLSRLAAKHTNALIIYETCLFMYLIGWEFFFRGFLLFGLAAKTGEAAIYIQALAYVAMHLGKSQAEAVAAIPAGIALGYLAGRTGSVWYGIVLHWLCAVTLDLFVIYRLF